MVLERDDMRKTGFWLSIFILAGLLSACRTTPETMGDTPDISTFDRQTADLADISSDVVDLIARVDPQRVLVVFDLDNTLLAMDQGLGSDQWYDWQKRLSTIETCDPRYVGERFAVQGALYFASAMRPTQADAASQVAALQERGLTVIALTSRGQDYRLQTFRELRRNGYDFTHSAFGPPGGYDEAFVPVQDGRLSRYEDGVFLTAGQHKGKMLHALLQKTGAPLPAVVVMIDDKQKNLDAVMETFGALGVAVHAWRYTGEDDNVENFDEQKAHAQWTALEGPLRDIQAVVGADNFDLSSVSAPECD